MSRNTSKNEKMEQHPEMAKAMSKATRHSHPTKRALAGFGSSSSDRPRPFEMTDSPAGGGEIIAHAIHYDADGKNDLPEDAVLVCVMKQYAKEPFAGPCKHIVFRKSELTPFDPAKYQEKKETQDVQVQRSQD